jgi:intraflagellar transport protein 88
MTSVAGAGFSSKSQGMSRFMDASAKALGPAPPLLEKVDNSPEEAAKDMEKKVHALLEGSADAAVKGDYVLALERAKEAGRKERSLCKFRDSNSLRDSINMDLTYAVCFNLANAVRKQQAVDIK